MNWLTIVRERSTKLKMNRNFIITNVIGLLCVFAVFATYWCGGGNFKRGYELGATVIFSFFSVLVPNLLFLIEHSRKIFK